MARRSARRQVETKPQTIRPPMLTVTIDALPDPFQVLGLVEASTRVPADVLPMAHLLDMLEDQAASMGANGVIGIRLSQATVPGSSRDRLLGRVTDHYGSMVMATALGTAVLLLPSADSSGTQPHDHRQT